MTLYFIRHGETDWNVKKKIQGKTDIPLNENGLQQAKELAGELLEKRTAGELQAVRVYTSPQLRAAVTAKIAAEALGIGCIPLSGLAEMDLGEWEGLNWQSVEEAYGDTYHYWNAHRRYTKTPGGESYQQVLARTLEALRSILAHETEDVLIVTHSAVLMSLRCYLAECPFEEMVEKFKLKNCGVVPVSSETVSAAVSRFFETGERNGYC